MMHSSFPIFSITVSGSRSAREITSFTKNIVKKRLENIPGVGSVDLVGGAEKEVQIEIDAARFEAYNLSIQDVINSVGTQNVEIPGGNLTNGPLAAFITNNGKIQES